MPPAPLASWLLITSPLWSCLRTATEAVFRHDLSIDLGPLSVSYTYSRSFSVSRIVLVHDPDPDPDPDFEMVECLLCPLGTVTGNFRGHPLPLIGVTTERMNEIVSSPETAICDQ